MLLNRHKADITYYFLLSAIDHLEYVIFCYTAFFQTRFNFGTLVLSFNTVVRRKLQPLGT